MRARIRYRVGQFWHGLQASVAPGERCQIAAILTPAALDLFDRMPVDAQRHSLNVLQTLRSAGHAQADLWVAALLHDVGKLAAEEAGVRLGLWLRGPLVLAEAVAPAFVRRLAVHHPDGGWRYALHVHLEHPRIGSDWAQAAGCSALTCWLIEHHQDAGVSQASPGAPSDLPDGAPSQLLVALQWADGQN